MPGGIILLRTGEIGPNVRQRHVYSWDLGDHLYFLGERTAERYAAKLDLKLVHREKAWVPATVYTRQRFLLKGRSRLRNVIKATIVRHPWRIAHASLVHAQISRRQQSDVRLDVGATAAIAEHLWAWLGRGLVPVARGHKTAGRARGPSHVRQAHAAVEGAAKKRLRPPFRRELAGWLQGTFQVSCRGPVGRRSSVGRRGITAAGRAIDRRCDRGFGRSPTPGHGLATSGSGHCCVGRAGGKSQARPPGLSPPLPAGQDARPAAQAPAPGGPRRSRPADQERAFSSSRSLRGSEFFGQR